MKWDSEKIRYMRDAAERSDYYRQIASVIVPHLKKDAHVCDAGCGLGYLSAALAPQVAQVTAVDISAEALAVLESRKIPNVTALCGDAAALVPESPYDAMIFCFFGSVQEVLEISRAQCRGSVFIITRGDPVHGFSQKPLENNRFCFSGFCEGLRQQGIPFESGSIDAEFGQPLKSLEDAKRFLALYGGENVEEGALRKRLRECTGEFPWYLPRRKRVGWIRFSVNEEMK